MKITTILFDLDGTLLPMDQDTFISAYSGGLAMAIAPSGFDKATLGKALWAGISSMVKNDGNKTNEEVFNEAFSAVLGMNISNLQKSFDEYYVNEFPKVKNACGYEEKAADTVREIKNMGFRVALATNPFFPSTATEQRIGWTGLTPADFEIYTTFEDYHFCKPNLDYYREVMANLGVDPEECLMVGNDVGEDMITEQLGCKVFLLTKCLINKENKDISVYPHGDLDDLLAFIKAL